MKKKSGHRRRTKVVRRSRKNLRRTVKRKKLGKGRRRPTRRYSRVQRGGVMTEDAEGHYKLGKAWQYYEDYTEAVLWYRLAAEQGHPGAQFNLGVMFMIGLGVDYDFAEAARLYRLAAEQGHAEAAHALGIMSEKGLGVERYNSAAVEWYIKALKLGNVYAEKAFHRLTGRS